MPTEPQTSPINNTTWTMNGPDGKIEIGSYDAEVARSFIVGMLAGFEASGQERELASFLRTELVHESQEFLARAVGLGRVRQATARVLVEDHRQFCARVTEAAMTSKEVVEMIARMDSELLEVFDQKHRESLEIMERDVRRMTLQRIAEMCRSSALAIQGNSAFMGARALGLLADHLDGELAEIPPSPPAPVGG